MLRWNGKLRGSSRNTIILAAIILFATIFFHPDCALALGFSVDLLESSYYYDMQIEMGDQAPMQASAHWTGTTNQSFSQKLTLYPPYYFDYVSAEALSLTAHASTYDWSSWGEAFVSGSWLFQPTETADKLCFYTWNFNTNLRHDGWTALYIILNDITDDHVIFDKASYGALNYEHYESVFGDAWEGHSSDFIDENDWLDAGEAINNQFFTDHIYELKMGVASQSNDDDPYIDLTACMNVASVPEPSTILLLGTGIIGLAGWKRKKYRSN